MRAAGNYEGIRLDMCRRFAWISKKILAGANYVFFSKFGQGVRGFVKIIIGVRKLWVNISRNLERVCMDFQEAMFAGRNHTGIFLEIQRRVCMDFQKAISAATKLWGNLCRNLEMVCVGFQKEILAGGNNWGMLLEIWRGLAWISKKQYWLEESMRKFSRNFGEGLRGLLNCDNPFPLCNTKHCLNIKLSQPY